jgi:hypothetical protein
MKIDLSLELVLKYFDKEVKEIDFFQSKFEKGTWNDHDILFIYDLQLKGKGFQKLDKLIEDGSTGNHYLHNELKSIKELLR